MRPNPPKPNAAPDNVETMPAPLVVHDPAMPVSDCWDSEAPTVVQTRRPVFAGPPPLPRT